MKRLWPNRSRNRFPTKKKPKALKRGMLVMAASKPLRLVTTDLIALHVTISHSVKNAIKRTTSIFTNSKERNVEINTNHQRIRKS